MNALFALNASSLARKVCAWITLVAFLVTGTGLSYAQQALALPIPGTQIELSPAFTPALVRGMRLHPENALQFDFIVDAGDSGLKEDALKKESEKLIRYFLASLTLPENELWVNLSPYEKDRIVPDELGTTEMGRDMLAQDYLLKQITASLTNPDNDLGKEFWAKVYRKAFEYYGTTDVPLDTFNKVWIMPAEAEVYTKDNNAFIVNSKLKVMLESDYAAMEHNDNVSLPLAGRDQGRGDIELAKDVVRSVILPALEKEVNEGKNFAQLRQIYSTLILAYWYKTALKESILTKTFADQHKVKGIDLSNKETTQAIYDQYVASFKKGALNMVREEYDPYTEKTIPRKYFSGGVVFDMGQAYTTTTSDASMSSFLKEGLQWTVIFCASLILASNISDTNGVDKMIQSYRHDPKSSFNDLSKWLSREDFINFILKNTPEGSLLKDIDGPLSDVELAVRALKDNPSMPLEKLLPLAYAAQYMVGKDLAKFPNAFQALSEIRQYIDQESILINQNTPLILILLDPDPSFTEKQSKEIPKLLGVPDARIRVVRLDENFRKNTEAVAREIRSLPGDKKPTLIVNAHGRLEEYGQSEMFDATSVGGVFTNALNQIFPKGAFETAIFATCYAADIAKEATFADKIISANLPGETTQGRLDPTETHQSYFLEWIVGLLKRQEKSSEKRTFFFSEEIPENHDLAPTIFLKTLSPKEEGAIREILKKHNLDYRIGTGGMPIGDLWSGKGQGSSYALKIDAPGLEDNHSLKDFSIALESDAAMITTVRDFLNTTYSQPDAAETSIPGDNAKGGIDFNAKNLNIKFTGTGVEFRLPEGVSPETLINARGFKAIITDMAPIKDLGALLNIH